MQRLKETHQIPPGARSLTPPDVKPGRGVGQLVGPNSQGARRLTDPEFLSWLEVSQKDIVGQCMQKCERDKSKTRPHSTPEVKLAGGGPCRSIRKGGHTDAIQQRMSCTTSAANLLAGWCTI